MASDDARLIDALQRIAKIARSNYEQDTKLRANGARALKRIAEAAETALNPQDGESKMTTTKVNDGISDIWFNYDKSSAELTDQGKFAGYDQAVLRVIAGDFRGSLEYAGFAPQIIPTVDDLIADFNERL